ncbi:hypothetical protein [Ralstonia phage phiRSL1]|uniref:Uncharacterized protein n=1 Tax=Ralstonia phage phiRSL1 TaxID=1980924 RepID=B2ZXS9_9CAUD|nr:hypothetical protein RSL1_ORF040 [Ralstonia phage phiRSL1]BAG41485.1 hypothetical protein [Ralstonia phage phiRSL1]
MMLDFHSIQTSDRVRARLGLRPEFRTDLLAEGALDAPSRLPAGSTERIDWSPTEVFSTTSVTFCYYRRG